MKLKELKTGDKLTLVFNKKNGCLQKTASIEALTYTHAVLNVDDPKTVITEYLNSERLDIVFLKGNINYSCNGAILLQAADKKTLALSTDYNLVVDDRRSSYRYDYSTKCMYTINGASGEYYAQVVNISATGLQFITNTGLRSDARITLNLYNKFDKTTYPVKLQQVSVTSSNDSGYLYGFKYLEFNDWIQKLLDDISDDFKHDIVVGLN